MYFHNVNSNNHIFRISAKLLIAASFLCVLFGNGTHMHSVFDHFSDHGDIHAYVHAHTAESNHDHTSEFDEKDTHQHPTATIELEGTLTHKSVMKVSSDENTSNEAGVIPVAHSYKTVNPLFSDLPPPDLIFLSDHFSSHSLRGPPVG